jgi:prepilin-type N-terminal cleavage/methylation domain-containing protein
MSVKGRRDGFTLIEVLVAIGILCVGILALLQTASTITIMLRDGRLRTMGSAMAASRIDNLRLVASSTTPTCTALASGSASSLHGTETWTIAGVGRSRTVTEVISVSTGQRTLGMTVRGTLLCP